MANGTFQIRMHVNGVFKRFNAQRSLHVRIHSKTDARKIIAISKVQPAGKKITKEEFEKKMRILKNQQGVSGMGQTRGAYGSGSSRGSHADRGREWLTFRNGIRDKDTPSILSISLSMTSRKSTVVAKRPRSIC